MSTLAPLLQAFFTERLIGQRDASPHTIASYRDAICLLLRFAQQRTGKAPHQLDINDLDAPLIGAFLNHLESDRAVSVRTRNARLTAIRSLFSFAAYRHPEHAAVIQRVLAIPPKRTDRALVTYLNQDEMRALLAAPDRATRIGRRDHALLLLALETGLRVSELTALTCGAVHLGTGPTSAATAKAAKSGSHHCADRLGPCCTPGSPRGLGRQPIRCSQAPPGDRSAATPSGAWSSATSPPQPSPAHPYPEKRSAHTPCGTAAP